MAFIDNPPPPTRSGILAEYSPASFARASIWRPRSGGTVPVRSTISSWGNISAAIKARTVDKSSSVSWVSVVTLGPYAAGLVRRAASAQMAKASRVMAISTTAAAATVGSVFSRMPFHIRRGRV